MTGRLFLASGALPGGLVCSLHAPAVPLLPARATVHEIAEYAALMSVAFAGQMVWRMLGAGHPMGARRVDSRAIEARGALAFAKEGVTAFLEQRLPRCGDHVYTDPPAFFPWWADRSYA